MLIVEKGALPPDSPLTAQTQYSLAAVLAHEGRSEEAVATLKDAFTHGLAPGVAAGLAKDEDFASLQSRPDFLRLSTSQSQAQPAGH